eukprot:241498-Heterocapsa_arctica.AAC.1
MDRPDVGHEATRPPGERRGDRLELVEIPPVGERRAEAWQPALFRHEQINAAREQVARLAAVRINAAAFPGGSAPH